MSDVFLSILLGLIQGLTEFIPVSSSGHLVFARELFGIPVAVHDLGFDAVLQLATTVAVFIYFRKEILGLFRTALGMLLGQVVADSQRSLFFALLVGTVPAMIIGLFLEEYMETVFRSATLVAWMLIVGAVLMCLADLVGKQNAILTVPKGLLIGFFQTLALVPGISRAGATISGGLFAGLSRESAAHFSFLLSFPILLGSGLKKFLDFYNAGTLSLIGMDLLFASIAAFLAGLFAIHFLILYLQKHSLAVFILYRVLLAVLIFLFVA